MQIHPESSPCSRRGWPDAASCRESSSDAQETMPHNIMEPVMTGKRVLSMFGIILNS
jgi:hypothetical protein